MDPDKLRQDYEAARAELHVSKRKLDSKCEALLILSRDLDQCRQERDQFKLMAEQVQARYQSIKRQLAGVGPRQSSLDGVDYSDMKHQSLAHLLCEMRDVNKSLQFEVDDLKQKLKDAHGDIRLLREQVARHRVGVTDEGMDTRHFPAHEREDLVHQLEVSSDKVVQIERDLQHVLDEKEELITERDVYRIKYERLNKELNYILKGDEKRVLDIDALIAENRYLQERIHQIEDEKAMAVATIAKYKSILDSKRNKGILKLGQSRSGGVVISQKQVHQLLENESCLTPTPQMMADLQSLSSALLESLNDKNVALSHQRKTNRILGERVAELEKKLKTLEMAGLWNTTGGSVKCASSGQLQQNSDDVISQFSSAAPPLPLSEDTEEERGDLSEEGGRDEESLQDGGEASVGGLARGFSKTLMDFDQLCSELNGVVHHLPDSPHRTTSGNSHTQVPSSSSPLISTPADHSSPSLSPHLSPRLAPEQFNTDDETALWGLVCAATTQLTGCEPFAKPASNFPKLLFPGFEDDAEKTLTDLQESSLISGFDILDPGINGHHCLKTASNFSTGKDEDDEVVKSDSLSNDDFTTICNTSANNFDSYGRFLVKRPIEPGSSGGHGSSPPGGAGSSRQAYGTMGGQVGRPLLSSHITTGNIGGSSVPSSEGCLATETEMGC